MFRASKYRIKNNVSFSRKKDIVPWYDSGKFCCIVLILMAAVIFFAYTGISVAKDNPDYESYAWVPFLLLILSCFVFLSLSFRLIRRRRKNRRFKQ